MALTKCSECGSTISDKASACVRCGYPLKKQKEYKYKIVLTKAAQDNTKTVALIQSLCGWSEFEAVRMCNSIPVTLKSNLSFEEAEKIKESFAEREEEISAVKMESSTNNYDEKLNGLGVVGMFYLIVGIIGLIISGVALIDTVTGYSSVEIWMIVCAGASIACLGISFLYSGMGKIVNLLQKISEDISSKE